jgi:hypothetical protein
VPDAAFLGLDRLENGDAAARSRLDADPALSARVDRALAWLVEDGASPSDALVALLAELEAERPAMPVIDMLEQGLDRATQVALISWLRRRGREARTLFLLTRSSAILDLDAVGGRRGDHPLPRQSQCADPRHSRRPRLRGRRHLPGAT